MSGHQINIINCRAKKEGMLMVLSKWVSEWTISGPRTRNNQNSPFSVDIFQHTLAHYLQNLLIALTLVNLSDFASKKGIKIKKNGFTLLILSDRATKGTGLANEKIMSILVACIMCTINGKIIQKPERKAVEKRNDRTDRAKGWKINSPEQQRNNAKDPEGYKG